MQGTHSKERPQWHSLAPELLVDVFKHLNMRDKMRAETSCRSWHRVLTSPQNCELWSPRKIDLENMSSFLTEQLPLGGYLSFSERLLPMGRWLQTHSQGCVLHLTTLWCSTCNSEEHTACEKHADNSRVEMISAGFAMLVAALQGLRVDVCVRLSCKSQLEGQDSEATLQHVDWSPLIWLTCLTLDTTRGSLSAASTVPNLERLTLSEVLGRPDQRALQHMSNLTCLSFISFSGTDMLEEEMGILRNQASLRSLHIEWLPDSSYELFAGGVTGLCCALGRLTMLTSLVMNHAGYPGFNPAHLRA
ncbi:hypothetical protein WJX73_008631 [Symbiochloris irregularis]|uniref:F-box domain-containing protein n=1 Tax=Symbiochloris irregularis TaxID=706552 RepID=A0AAW1PCQ0_9CHLO